jgi:hypothetical protein
MLLALRPLPLVEAKVVTLRENDLTNRLRKIASSYPYD